MNALEKVSEKINYSTSINMVFAEKRFKSC